MHVADFIEIKLNDTSQLKFIQYTSKEYWLHFQEDSKDIFTTQ